MKSLLTLAVAGMAVMSSQAQAAPTITFTDRNYTLPSGRSASIFRDFESSPDAGAQYVPAANETKTGDVRVYSSTSSGLAVDPDNANGNHFLSILNGSYSVNFATPAQFFSFVIGSVDSYNNLLLTYANGTSQSFQGRQIIGDTVVGPFNSNTWGRVSYDLGSQPGIVSARFSSTQQSLEIDDLALASAVPEASVWIMMMFGLGTIGFAMRRRTPVAVRFA